METRSSAVTARSLRTEELLDGQVLRIEFASAPGNILDLELVRELTRMVAAVSAAEHSAAETKAILLEGGGDHFSYGASIQDHLPDRIGPFLHAFHELFRELCALSVPLVAVVRGCCLGGGLELAAFCHRVVASPSARFSAPEIKLGLFAPVASLVLPARIGQPAADDLLLTGRTIGAEEARALRLVDSVEADPRAGALEWVREHLLAHSASSLRHATRAARHVFTADFLAHLEAVERLYLDELMATTDAVEGIHAFLEKRKPRFGA